MMWQKKWFRIVAISALAITLAILAYDVVLIATKKPTISGVVWLTALRTLSVPFFVGGLGGHWFITLPQPRFLSRYGVFLFFGLLLVLVTLDVIMRWAFPYWVPGLVFVASQPLGAFLWGLKKKRLSVERGK